MKKQELKELKEGLLTSMNSISIDFINDYSINNNGDSYLSDLFTECADSCISIYYSDQFKYYSDNSTECEDALLELYDGGSLYDIIKNQGLYNLCCTAGVAGEFRENESELYEDIDDICACLLINYMLDNFNKFNKKDFNIIYEKLENINGNYINKLSDILDALED